MAEQVRQRQVADSSIELSNMQYMKLSFEIATDSVIIGTLSSTAIIGIAYIAATQVGCAVYAHMHAL